MVEIAGGILLALLVLYIGASVLGLIGMVLQDFFGGLFAGIRAINKRMKRPPTPRP